VKAQQHFLRYILGGVGVGDAPAHERGETGAERPPELILAERASGLGLPGRPVADVYWHWHSPGAVASQHAVFSAGPQHVACAVAAQQESTRTPGGRRVAPTFSSLVDPVVICGPSFMCAEWEVAFGIQLETLR
jgi:hypothetical protein